TVALVTPDRVLARRVSALLGRWGIEADDSAGRSLSELPSGTLLLGIAAAMAEELAPVPLLALLKHPSVGGEEAERLKWLDDVRQLDLALRGPRPAGGLAGLDRHFAAKEQEPKLRGCLAAWQRVRPRIELIEGHSRKLLSLKHFAAKLVEAVQALAGDSAWRGQDGRMAADLLAAVQASPEAEQLNLSPEDWVPILRQLLEGQSVRPLYGDHPRVFIW